MEFTEEQEEILSIVNAFCDANVSEEKVSQWVQSHGVPRKMTKQFYDSRMGEFCLPENCGGAACTMLGRVTLIEQLTRRMGATLPFLSVMVSMALISTMRDLSQQEIYEELLSKAGWIGFSQAFSEPNAGTDASAVRTVITVEGNDILLDGEKSFVSAGQFMPETLVLTHDPVFGCADGGLSLWLVPIDAPGISTFPLETIGQEMLAPATIHFEKVKLSPDWRIQSEGKLDVILKRQYELGRLLVCASSLGLAEAAFDDALAYSTTHMSKGRLISGIPQIQEKIADCETDLRAMRMLVYDAAAEAEDNGTAFHLNCALMKRSVPRMATEVASRSLQIFGGLGYTEETRVGRIWRDCRGNQIAQGTDEVMTHLAAKFIVNGELRRQAQQR